MNSMSYYLVYKFNDFGGDEELEELAKEEETLLTQLKTLL